MFTNMFTDLRYVPMKRCQDRGGKFQAAAYNIAYFTPKFKTIMVLCTRVEHSGLYGGWFGQTFSFCRRFEL